ncbi:MAG TPA: RdgB/HAM1 family non-canonical purine NTP pyrophosphatase [Tepidisphaeraceae bacterium]|nr:RdgB/HAM1 family non-canonical purine NTP pyrophosphatase [Tepidisphaeraceae bacterium]
MRIVIATRNAGKVREFEQMLATAGLEFVPLSHFPALPEPAETAISFHANAAIKAGAYARATGCWALADDSGLQVDALGGRPGVHSARWASINHAGSGDADNNALLLRQLRDVPDHRRTARFACALVLSDPAGRVALASFNTVEGTMGRAPRGTGGFGYDPLFVVTELNRTTAELSSDEKHAISHRGKALARLRLLMRHLPDVRAAQAS